jgi:hypothetical protein
MPNQSHHDRVVIDTALPLSTQEITAPIIMSNTIEIITLVINAIDLLIVIMQVCLTWARGARLDDNNNHRARRINEAEAGREMHR